ncbi:MAG TPA: ATP-binding protein, partial [Thermoanaerobaculia bacterium]|nr:ATP-binding protein [Thermoanaerobaculia bacterium]
RNVQRDDVLGDILVELNGLASIMESRKLEAVEAAALLRAVLAEIDAAIFAFDANGALQLVNRAGERLLASTHERLAGRTANEIGLDELLASDTRRWNVRRSTFREKGVEHTLLVVSDISRALREEEIEAWRRIVRVLGHELNNSLAPIKSIATSVERLVTREPLASDWQDDVLRGMRVVGSRAESLTRFTRAYAQLARLPEPQKREVALADLVRRVAALETRVPVRIAASPAVTIEADEDQLEQALINLLKNAADASLETGGAVTIHWRAARGQCVIAIEDEGAGLTNSANVFVPFFTTKPSGTGVGLFLSRQIAEAHGGTLTLENRRGTRGCVATLTVPGAQAHRLTGSQ